MMYVKTSDWGRTNLYCLEQIDDILNKLYIYRSKIKRDFEQKVEAMNKATENLINAHE